MASWVSNGGGIQGKNQLGFGNFNKNPFESSNMPNFTGGFGSNSALLPKGNDFTARQTVNSGFGSNSGLLPKGNDSKFATQPPFGSYPIGQSPFCTKPTGVTPLNSINASKSVTQPPFGSYPIGQSPLCTNPTDATPLNSVKASKCATQPPFGSYPIGQSPFCSNPTGATPLNSVNASKCATQPPFGSYPIGQSPFCTNPTGTAPLNSVNASKSGIQLPFGSYPIGQSPFCTNPTDATPFSSGNSPSRGFPFGTSSKISSPQSPMTCFETSSTGNQGTRLAPYARTRPEEGDIRDRILSISAMPFYEKKSHEELRLEDYQLNGKTGSSEIILSISADPLNKEKSHEELRLECYQLTGKAGTKSSFSFPISNTSTSAIPSLIPNASPSSTATIPKFCFVDPSSSGSISLGPSISNTTCTSYEPTPFVPLSQPVISTAPPIGTVTQTTTSVPNSGNPFAISTALTTESIITSIPQPVSTGGFIPSLGSLTEIKQQQQPTSLYDASVGQSLVTNPFATEVRHTPPITTLQYGISCLPVSDIAKPAKGMPLVNVRHLSLGRRRPPIEKYKPNNDEKKVPFYEEFPGIYKNSAALIPRENPRAWIVRPNEQQRLEKSLSNLSVSAHSTDICETGGTQSESFQVKEEAGCVPKMNLSKDIKHDHEDSDISAHDADVIAMIPKLTCPEYFMEPSTDDLAANELKRPGFCRQVKDFVIGRHNYGSIKFLGETDVRNLDLESIVQFNTREVIVYLDEKVKPPVGQGLNKAAEITLLNIRCIDKNTGKQYIDGPKADKYKQFLVRKTMEQGVEFLSFDPAKGEWRFKVEHF